jgi:hypothetical protein
VAQFIDFQPAIMTNIGWGTLRKPEYHSEIKIRDMHLGYFESGIIFKKCLLRVIDVGCMYRYGHYGFDKFSDNFTLTFGVGM